MNVEMADLTDAAFDVVFAKVNAYMHGLRENRNANSNSSPSVSKPDLAADGNESAKGQDGMAAELLKRFEKRNRHRFNSYKKEVTNRKKKRRTQGIPEVKQTAESSANTNTSSYAGPENEMDLEFNVKEKVNGTPEEELIKIKPFVQDQVLTFKLGDESDEVDLIDMKLNLTINQSTSMTITTTAHLPVQSENRNMDNERNVFAASCAANYRSMIKNDYFSRQGLGYANH